MRKFKSTIRAMLSILMATIVFVLMGGFNLYTHHCNHQNISNHSFIVPSSSCNDAEAHSTETSCCKPVVEKSCCEKPEQKDAADDCCTDTHNFVKLNVDTFLNFSAPKIQVQLLSICSVFNLELFTNTHLSAKLLAFPFHESPPSKHHNYYLSFIQVFLI